MMTTNLKTTNKAEALNIISQAVSFSELPCLVEDIYFNVGRLEGVSFNLLNSVAWNDIRYIAKNLDIATFYYQVEEERVSLDTRWDVTTQQLSVSQVADISTSLSANTPDLTILGTEDTTPTNRTEDLPLVEEVSEQVTEVADKSVEVTPQPSILSKTSTNKSLNIYVSRTNSEGLAQKILVNDITASELLGIIKPWLVATGKLAEFKKELQETKHNSIVLYLNPSYEWSIREITREKEVSLLDSFLEYTKGIRELLGVEQFSQELFNHLKDVEKWSAEELVQASAIKTSLEVNGTFHLRTVTRKETTFKPIKREISSAYISQITNRAGSDIQRPKKEAVPELGSLENISPILVDGIYLAQSYVLFDPDRLEFSREVRRVAVQQEGKFYYLGDLSREEADLHNLEPLVEVVDGKEVIRDCENTKDIYFTGKHVFPDLSIQMVQFESLDSDGNTLKLQHYQKTSGVWILSDAIESTNNLMKDQHGNLVTDLRFVATPVSFLGFPHPNIKPKESFRNEDGSVAISSTTQRQTPKKAKLTNLSDARLVAQNSLTWMGFLSNVPCIVTLVNSKDHWQLEALPIQEIPKFPLLYCLANKAIEGYWQEEDLSNQIIIPLDEEVRRLEGIVTSDTSKFEKISRRVTQLNRLRKSVLNREKLDSKILAECTDIVKKAISEASYRPSVTDKYFSRYILAQVYFVSTNEDKITYLLDDYMSHKRQATQVISALRWLTRVPNNLQKQFPSKRPTTQDLRQYLVSKFNENFREVELKVRENQGKILLDIIYNGKIQVTQVLTIKMPATEGKNRGKVSTKVNGTPNFAERSVFEKFLRSKDGRFVSEAMNQLRHLVNIFLSRNFNTLVGEGKVGHQRKVSEIIGFERSKSGWSEIKRGFVKSLLPYSSNSEVKAGKLVYLATNQALSSQDLELLIVQVAENWKNWSRKDQLQIKIGNSFAKNSDPEILVHVLTKKILSGNFEEDREAWQDTINWFAEVCKFSNEYKAIGFRFDNGVILTPDCIYDSDIERWEHRIKIQLANLLLDSDEGNIEAWLQKSVDYLYDSLDRLKSNWENQDKYKVVGEHLTYLHDCHGRALEVVRNKAIY